MKKHITLLGLLAMLLISGNLLASTCSANFNNTTNNLTASFINHSSIYTNSWLWHFGDGTTSSSENPSHTYPSAGTYTVLLQAYDSTTNCVDSITKIVNITGANSCMAGFSSTTNNLTVSFTNTSSANTNYWFWDFGDGSNSSSQNPSHTYNSSGTYQVLLRAYNISGACMDSIVKNIAVINLNGTCDASYSFTKNGLEVAFNSNSSSSLGVQTYHTWDFGNGDSAYVADTNYTYPVAGTYITCHTVTKYNTSNWSVLCTDTYCDTVTVASGGTIICNADFSSTTNNLTVSFTNLSSANTLVWDWDFGDGGSSHAQNPSYTYSSAGSYWVKLIAYDASNIGGAIVLNCVDTITKMVTVTGTAPICDASYSFTKNGLQVAFNGSSSNSSGVYTNHSWDFGNGDSAYGRADTNYTYPVAGTYVVCHSITKYNTSNWSVICTDTYCDSITVTGGGTTPCVADFSSTTNNLTANFTNLSSTNTNTWSWHFGDGSTSTAKNPSHTYAASGSYPVLLQVYDSTTNCVDSIIKYVTVINLNVTCNANYSYTTNGLQVALNSNSSFLWGIQTQHSWDFGNGDSAYGRADTNYTYPVAGTYVVCHTVTKYNTSNWAVLCTDTYCDTITVTGGSTTCNANYSYTTNGLSASFTNLSSPSTSLSWDFGDGTGVANSPNPVHTYSSPGVYSVRLRIYNTNCYDSIVKNVFVNTLVNQCVADFNYFTNGLNVSFTNTSSSNTNSWFWDFGDGTLSNAQHPNYTYSSAGTYNVMLISNDSSCTDTTYKSVTVTNPPVSCNANYNYNKSGLTVNFTDQSSGVNSLFWYFGDGAFSAAQNPTHTYPAAGTYTAVLIAYDNSGSCSDTISKTITVSPVVCVADFSFSVSNLTVSFTDQSSSNINARDWDFGDGTFSTSLTNPTHTYLSSGTYSVRMIAYDTNDGCSDTVTKLVTVYNPAQCNAIFFALSGTTTSTTGIPITFFNASIGSSNASWSFGDGFSSNAYSPTHIYNSPGWYNVCLTINDSNCSDVTCDSIYIDSSFTIQAVFNYTQVGNNHVAFTNGSTQRANMSYYWDFGDGNTSTEMSPTHQYAQGGSYTVCLIATDNVTKMSAMYCESFVDPSASVGIVEDAEKEIKVYPNPVSNMLTVDAEEISNIKVYTTTGLMVLDTDATKIDMSRYSSGMYIVQIQFNDQSIATKRVVKTQ